MGSMKVALPAAAALLIAAAGANAQITVTPGGANAGNGYFAQGAQPTSLTGSGIGTSNFGATSPTIADQLFGDWWWFRELSDTREYTFANGAVAGGPTSVGVVVGNNLGTLDTGGYDYTVTNATAGYSFFAALRWQIFNAGAGAFVNYSAMVTNTGNNPIDLSLFHYNDFDTNATAGGDTWTYSSDVYTITDVLTLYHTGVGPAAHQSTAFAALRNLLANTAVNNLDNTDVGSPGDYTAAFQWNLALAAGGSATVGGTIGFVPAPGALALLGLGGLMAARRRRS